MWNKPQSVFANFKNDSLGKCEVCFRAGFCTMNECSVQKKFEISVINSTVDKAKLNGMVDDKPLKEMLKKIIKNQKVNFKNTIIIMTSNIGARDLQDFGAGIGFSTSAKEGNMDELKKGTIHNALKKAFAPEFLNRIEIFLRI